MMDLLEAAERVKRTGRNSSRIVPSNCGETYNIEILENGSWLPILTNVDKNIAESIINQQRDNVILG